jgi:hypothetical protein
MARSHTNRKTETRRDATRRTPKDVNTTALLFCLEEISLYARQAEIEAVKQGLLVEAKALKKMQLLNAKIYRRAGGTEV